MSHLLGSTYTDRFTVLSAEGVPITGATFTADQLVAPDQASFGYTVTELSLGMYQVSWTLAQTGTYYLRLVTGSVPGFPFQSFEFEVTTDDPEAGEGITHYFTVLDDDGLYLSASTVTVDLALDPVGLSFVPLVEALGLGLYRVTWPSVTAGVYTLRLSADRSASGDEPSRFEFEDQVLVPVVTPSPLITSVGASLDDLVRAVALLCRDIIYTRATSDGPDGKTWPDRQALAAKPAKTFKGANLFIYQASPDTNVGVEAMIADSVDRALVLEESLPGLPRRGDLGYIVNLESNGQLRQTYIAAINNEIANAWPIHLVPAEATTTVPFDPDQPWLLPPPEFTHLYSVSYPTPGGAPYQTFIPGDDKDRAGWWWDTGGKRIVIGGGYREAARDTNITIRGYGAAPRLERDEAQTSVPRKWLTEMVAGDLIISTRDPRRIAEGQNHINRADAWLPELTTMVEPGTVKIV
jgi:hypothetical protein